MTKLIAEKLYNHEISEVIIKHMGGGKLDKELINALASLDKNLVGTKHYLGTAVFWNKSYDPYFNSLGIDFRTDAHDHFLKDGSKMNAKTKGRDKLILRIASAHIKVSIQEPDLDPKEKKSREDILLFVHNQLEKLSDTRKKPVTTKKSNLEKQIIEKVKEKVPGFDTDKIKFI
jgi:hypothetical protein